MKFLLLEILIYGIFFEPIRFEMCGGDEKVRLTTTIQYLFSEIPEPHPIRSIDRGVTHLLKLIYNHSQIDSIVPDKPSIKQICFLSLIQKKI